MYQGDVTFYTTWTKMTPMGFPPGTLQPRMQQLQVNVFLPMVEAMSSFCIKTVVHITQEGIAILTLYPCPLHIASITCFVTVPGTV